MMWKQGMFYFQNKEEVLSLYQYDAVDQHFLVPILESAWKALPDNTTMAVFNGINDKPSNPKVSIKREGIVIAKYNQPKRIDDATTDSSFQVVQLLKIRPMWADSFANNAKF